MRRAIAPLLGLLAAAGCTVGPNYRAPTPEAPAAFAGPQWTGPAPEIDLAHWWTAFHDPELERLIAIGMAQAPDLQTAASRVRQARLQIVAARAQGLPEISAAGSGLYAKSHSVDRGNIDNLVDRIVGDRGGQSGSASGAADASGIDGGSIPTSIKSLSAGFDASWTLDIFGGVRRGVEAARASTEAAEWDARDARIMLAGEIARDYLSMRSYQLQAQVAIAEVDRQSRSLQLIGHTAQVGLTPEGDTTRQRAQLASSRAQIAPLQAQALTQIHAIATLIGMMPQQMIDELKIERPLPDAPPAVPPGLPVDLIRRRPDVRAAERRLAAATAQIGVQVAQLYPQISLTAMPQFAAAWLGSFFLGDTLTLTAQGAASFPLIDFGRRRAQIDIAKEQREQSYIAWRQAVLQALRDVEDALVQYEAERRANLELAAGVGDAERSVRTTQSRFTVGLQDLQPVLDAQQQLLQLRNSKVQSDARLRQDLAALYIALGGGWSEADAPPQRPAIEDAPKRRGG